MRTRNANRQPVLREIFARISITKLARVLGISKMAVSQWRRVPAERALEINALTGIPLKRLRPDVYDRGLR